MIIYISNRKTALGQKDIVTSEEEIEMRDSMSEGKRRKGGTAEETKEIGSSPKRRPNPKVLPRSLQAMIPHGDVVKEKREDGCDTPHRKG